MRRIEHWTSALLLALAASSDAVAGGEDAKDAQGGRSSEPAVRTGSGAHGERSQQRTAGETGTNPRSAADLNEPASQQAVSPQGWIAKLNRQQIEQLQRELASRGLYRGVIDGVAGPQTTAALRRFQEQRGLPTEQGLDAQTLQALGMQAERQPVTGAQTSAGPELQRPVGQDAPAGGAGVMRSQVRLDTLGPEQLGRLQNQLRELGYFQGQADGKPGASTNAALQRFFQHQAELASRGLVGDMLLGVFGVSPPRLDPTTGRSPGVNSSGSTNPSGAGPSGAPSGSTGAQPGGATQPR